MILEWKTSVAEGPVVDHLEDSYVENCQFLEFQPEVPTHPKEAFSDGQDLIVDFLYGGHLWNRRRLDRLGTMTRLAINLWLSL